MDKKFITSAVFVFVAIFALSAEKVEASNCANLSANLRYGNSGVEVTNLQNFLIEKGYLTGSSTGFFGKLTQSAVKKFQTESGLPSTGLVMTMTRAKITFFSCNSQAVNNVSPAKGQPQVLGASISNIPTGTPTPTPTPSFSASGFTLPYSTTEFAGWKSDFGQVNITASGLELKAIDGATVAISSYPKADSLKDYKISSSIFAKRGTPILMARYKNDQNYVACYFLGESVDIVQKVNGEQTTLATVSMPDSPSRYFFFNDINVSMSVKGKSVGCTMIGSESNVTYNNIDDSLTSGGFGVQVWYDAPNVAEALVRNVKVQSI
jgi:hypothetical protein